MREICHGLQSCNGKLISLGVNRNPNKSTLSYANEHRPSELFRDMFWILMDKCRSSGRLGDPCQRKFRFKNKLLLFDSTTITLCLSLFPWAEFRRQKGGIKLHVLQIWTALTPQGAISLPFLVEQQIHLVALLVIKWLHYRSKVDWSFSNMVRQLADFA